MTMLFNDDAFLERTLRGRFREKANKTKPNETNKQTIKQSNKKQKTKQSNQTDKQTNKKNKKPNLNKTNKKPKKQT